MPFDNPQDRVELPVKHAEELKIIDGAMKVLERPERWIKGIMHLNWSQFCLIGAFHQADESRTVWVTELSPVVERVANRATQVASRRDYTPYHSLWHFNDRGTTTHADVMAVLRLTRASYE